MARPGPMPRATSKRLNAWLSRLARQVRIPLAAVIGVGLLGGILLIVQAWLLARVIDGVVMHGLGLPNVWPWLLQLLAVFALRAVVTAATDVIAFEAGARVALEIRERLQAHMVTLGPAWTRGQRTGQVANTVVDGVESLRKYYDSYLPQMALAVCIPLAILMFVFPSDWISGIVMVLAAPLIPFFMVLIGKGTEALNRSQWRQMARMSAQFFDMIEGLTTLKLFNASRHEIAVVARASDEYRLRTMAVLRVAFLSSLALEFFATISIALIAVYIGFRLYYREMDFLPGFFVLLMAPEFFRPLRNMGVQYHARMEAVGASEAIVELLETKPAAAMQPVPRTSGPAIAFEQVSFAYDPAAPVVEDASFTVARGERVAVVGPSGAGKTTLTQLLLGFIVPSSGQIRIDGVDLRDLPQSAWLQRVAWLPQRPTLFHGTVLDNIRLGRSAASMAEVRRAAELSHAADFIGELPHGYDTMVGDRGQGLSGGEIQRVALARVFLKQAEVVVFDEASAGLDPDTAALITRSIEILAPGRAMLIVAHRLETVRHASRILVLDRGRIVERGRHDDLLRQDSLYSSMVGLHAGAGA